MVVNLVKVNNKISSHYNVAINSHGQLVNLVCVCIYIYIYIYIYISTVGGVRVFISATLDEPSTLRGYIRLPTSVFR